jgi:hypothetical protein
MTPYASADIFIGREKYVRLVPEKAVNRIGTDEALDIKRMRRFEFDRAEFLITDDDIFVLSVLVSADQ